MSSPLRMPSSLPSSLGGGARRRRWVSLCFASTTLALALVGTRGCAEREGCLAGDDGVCVPATPCATVRYTCEDTALRMRFIEGAWERPPGLDALAARGDLLLGNSQMQVILDDLAAPHYLAPTGGNVLDLVPLRAGRITATDELNHISQAVGILPGDAVRYHSRQLLDRRPESVGVILRGTLDGRPRTTVVTRYEVRPCEPGVRVRTELFHGGREAETFFLGDAAYWGGRENASFSPAKDRGFAHPDLDLLEIDKAFTEQTFIASKPQNTDAATYAIAACGGTSLSGFHSTTVTAVGPPRQIVMPGDSLAHERFFFVGHGPGVSEVANMAMSLRQADTREAFVELTLRVVRTTGEPIKPSDRVGLLFYRVEANGRVPLNEAVPDDGGFVRVRVPRGKAFRVERHVMGRAVGEPLPFDAQDTAAALPDISVPLPGRFIARALDDAGRGVSAELVFTPTDEALARVGTSSLARGSMYGAFDIAHCDPYLGPPHGASPACNRALTGPGGDVELLVPDGDYWVYATRGPFSAIVRQKLSIRSGERKSLDFVFRAATSPLPAGALSADFHVHGGASFDSSLPELDRVRSLLAHGLDVIAATDHDVVTTYQSAIAQLGAQSKLRVLPGAETTGHVLFYRPPGSTVPKVVGHYNFWPLRHDANLPRNGLPWEELLEPGPLFDQVAKEFVGRGVIQFNHPLSATTLGRDEGFLTAIDFDARRPVPLQDDGTGAGQLRRRGATRSAMDFDVQEVMNGTSTKQFHLYRAAWHAFLAQGILRGGTANSDSHTLAVEVVGFPRNLVFGDSTLAGFDPERFNEDVRRGRMVGTNGPVIVADLDGARPSLDVLRPNADAKLRVTVDAMPWIPVEEVRIVVNGEVVQALRGAALTAPGDPFGTRSVRRYAGEFSLRDLLRDVPADSDAFIVIEAGLPLYPALDLNGDGYVDTTDNNDDGRIDQADRDGRDEDATYIEPARPPETDRRFHAQIVAPGHWSTAFTNPFVIDRGPPGYAGPGLRGAR